MARTKPPPCAPVAPKTAMIFLSAMTILLTSRIGCLSPFTNHTGKQFPVIPEDEWDGIGRIGRMGSGRGVLVEGRFQKRRWSYEDDSGHVKNENLNQAGGGEFGIEWLRSEERRV